MKLFVSYGDEKTNTWEALREIELRPYSELYPEQYKTIPRIPGMLLKVLGLNNEAVTLPNGEEIGITVAYTPDNRGLSLVISQGGKTLLNVGGFKSNEIDYDPSAVLLTPGGMHVSVMVGPESGRRGTPAHKCLSRDDMRSVAD